MTLFVTTATLFASTELTVAACIILSILAIGAAIMITVRTRVAAIAGLIVGVAIGVVAGAALMIFVSLPFGEGI